MKIRSLTLLFAASVASETVMVPRDPSDYTSMRPRELEAFQDVALKCHRDVAYYCDDSPFGPADTALPHFPLMLFRAEDPLADLGRLLDSIFSVDPVPVVQETHLIMVYDGSDVESAPEHPEQAAAVQALSHIAAVSDPEAVEDTTEQVMHRTQLILEHPEASETQRRLARRLQAVTTPEALLEQRRNFLPFGCPRRNRCLQQVYQQRLVSPPCGLALQRLEHVRAVQHLESVQRYHEQQFVLKHLLLLYVLVLATMAVLYCRRSPQVRQNRRLKQRILTAIYSQPALKAAVEQELGESLGAVPPLRWRTLMKFGLHGREYRAWSKVARRAWLLVVSCSAILLVLAPALFLPLCVGMAAALFWCAVSSSAPVRVCACCCCGASTEDAKSGNLTKDQECCGCCKGTGICAPSCASCCDNDDKGCCCCCGDGCCCCSGAGSSGSGCCCGCCSTASGVESGGCCCCGEGCCCCASKPDGGRSSSSKKKKSKGCSCCSGSGCCCCSGAACCGEGCSCVSGRGIKDPAVAPGAAKLCVYEGIPVQVV